MKHYAFLVLAMATCAFCSVSCSFDGNSNDPYSISSISSDDIQIGSSEIPDGTYHFTSKTLDSEGKDIRFVNYNGLWVRDQYVVFKDGNARICIRYVIFPGTDASFDELFAQDEEGINGNVFSFSKNSISANANIFQILSHENRSTPNGEVLYVRFASSDKIVLQQENDSFAWNIYTLERCTDDNIQNRLESAGVLSDSSEKDVNDKAYGIWLDMHQAK